MTIYRLQRWITWRIVQRTRDDGMVKDDKVPWNYGRDREMNAHDPNNWMTYDDAARTGKPIGFVFHANDPYFFLDLDRCRLGNGWRPEAERICAMFPGAAMEISQSGQGIHIVGRCDKLLTAGLKNKFGKEIASDLGLWCEFYTKERFMALGHGFQSTDFDRDYTNAILALVPRRETNDELLTGDGSGPVPEYTGPTDDDELIKRALASKSAAQAFGAKATFEHLWRASEYADVLMQHFPSPSGGVFDHSAADAALMAHLAFWTGKDAARMDRLFRRSDLFRPKYNDRPKYAAETIAGAIRGCRKVYDRVLPDDAAPAAAAAVEGEEYLTIAQQVEYFKGCVYVRSDHRIMIPTGDMLTPPQFKAFYGGRTFAMSADGSGPTRNAFEAFTENRAHQFPKVARTCFRPEASPGAIIDDMVNVYKPFTPRTMRGDPTPFLAHMAKLFPIDTDRAILVAYFAALAQHPGRKFRWAPMIQGVEGNGKSFLAGCMEYIVGQHYTHKPSANDLKNPFNSYLENKLLIVVEEVHTEGRRDLLDLMKPLITDERIETQPKGVDKRMIDNRANWMFFSNHKDAIPISDSSRRYAPFYCAQQHRSHLERDGMDGRYFVDLFRWARDGGGYAIVADYLKNYRIPAELDPSNELNRAPITSSTKQAVELSKGRAEQEIEEAIINNEPGFRGGWVSSTAVMDVLTKCGIRLSQTKIGEVMDSLGYHYIGRSSMHIMQENNKRPTLYVMNEKYTPYLTYKDYLVAQGYVAPNTVNSVVPFRKP